MRKNPEKEKTELSHRRIHHDARDTTHSPSHASAAAARAMPTSMLHDLDREEPLNFHDHFRACQILRRSPLVRSAYTRPAAKEEPTAIFAQRRAAGVPGGTTPALRERNSMAKHIAEAFGIIHPFLEGPSGLAPHVEEAIRFNASRSPREMQRLQTEAIRTLKFVSELQEPITKQLRRRMPPWVLSIAGDMDLGLMAAIGDAFPEWPHRSLVYDLVHGFVIVGQPVPDTGLFRPVDKPPTVDTAQVLAQNADEVRDVIERALRAANSKPDANRAVYEKTQQEVDKGLAIGPFSARDLNNEWGEGSWRPLTRFPVQQKGSIRPCDDAKRGLHNALMHLMETIQPTATADWAIRVVRFFASLNEDEARNLLFGTNDVADAYKVIPNGQPWFSTVAVVAPDSTDDSTSHLDVPMFYIIPGHNFGLASSVTNFNAVMEFHTFFSTIFLAAICDHFFDDVGNMARSQWEQDALMAFFELLGLPFAYKKWTPMGLLIKFLGTWTDLRELRVEGTMALLPDSDRMDDCLTIMTEAFVQARMAPRGAESLRGKLQFTLSSIFMKLGRTALPALTAHACQRSHTMSPAGLEALEFLIQVLIHLPPFETPARTPRSPQPLIWTDASFERRTADGAVVLAEPEPECYAGLGLVAWLPSRRAFVVASLVVSYDFLLRCFGEKIQYIGQLEAIAAAAAYWTIGEDDLTGSYPAHFIDNQGALAAIVRGDSSEASIAHLSHECALRHLHLRCTPWFEYVPSMANISDLPSRGKLAAVIRLLQDAFGTPVTTRAMSLPPEYHSMLEG